ncbi:MAG: alpha/beta hydrolase family protein, partial [Candidatus Acidiferrales bacterium]
RGSTGRGVAFSKLSQGDPAGDEFDDVMDAVEHLISQGLADPDRIGITGGSYGGYATAWGATYYSEHFAAAVMRVGISELLAKEGTTDIPQENYDVHFLVHPWDDWELFLERSPIRYAENARTPLLIAHGKDDPRVHPSQSLILYRYLRAASKAPVRLVYYPGEGHASRRASSRLDFNLRMLQWFEHYLKGPGGEPPPYELDYGLEEPAAKPAEVRR